MEAVLIDPDIKKVLELAHIDLAKVTDEQLAWADRCLQVYTTQDGTHRHSAAAEALWRKLNGGTA